MTRSSVLIPIVILGLLSLPVGVNAQTVAALPTVLVTDPQALDPITSRKQLRQRHGPQLPRFTNASAPFVHFYQHRTAPSEPKGYAELERKLAVAEFALGSHHADLIPILIELGLVRGEIALLERALTISEKEEGPGSAGVAAILLLLVQLSNLDTTSEPLLLRAISILESDASSNAKILVTALALLQSLYLVHGQIDAAKVIGVRIRRLNSE